MRDFLDHAAPAEKFKFESVGAEELQIAEAKRLDPTF
jgi:hypothetical protein